MEVESAARLSAAARECLNRVAVDDWVPAATIIWFGRV
jgi:hypothetical protein